MKEELAMKRKNILISVGISVALGATPAGAVTPQIIGGVFHH
jgi:hypothetical protein